MTMRLTKIRDIDCKKAEYICSCGNSIIAWKSNVKPGHTQSCGCLRKEITKNRATTHGHKSGGKRTKAYAAWVGMKSRCNNPNLPNSKNYMGRGISYDPSWESFENFIDDMGDPPEENLSLDRIDNDKGYSKNNCRWADRKTQNNNKRNNVRYEYEGKNLTLPEWSKVTGVGRLTMYKRIQRGVPLGISLFHKGFLKNTGCVYDN